MILLGNLVIICLFTFSAPDFNDLLEIGIDTFCTYYEFLLFNTVSEWIFLYGLMI